MAAAAAAAAAASAMTTKILYTQNKKTQTTKNIDHNIQIASHGRVSQQDS
jgi:hypothetical protein